MQFDRSQIGAYNAAARAASLGRWTSQYDTAFSLGFKEARGVDLSNRIRACIEKKKEKAKKTTTLSDDEISYILNTVSSFYKSPVRVK